MVSLRCKMIVKEELKNLGLRYVILDLGMVDILENIDENQRMQLKANLSKSGLELLDDKKSILIEKIKNVITEMVHYYVNIPVMLSLNTDKTKWVNLNFVAGPQFGMNVSSNLKNTGTPSDTLNAFVSVKKQDVGFAYGAGVELILNRIHTLRLDLGYRGFYGLVNMNDANSTPGNYNVIVKTSRKTYGAYVGLTFLF